VHPTTSAQQRATAVELPSTAKQACVWPYAELLVAAR
jgi:hypothetical protein